MGSTVVLLGAGASVDAGLPTSFELTEQIVRQVQDDPFLRHGGEAAALNHAVGAIIAHDARSGGSPYSGIDVERVFSAVQMLADRDSLEVSPFVGGWTDPRPAASDRLPAFWGKSLNEYIAKALSSSHPSTLALEREFAAGVRAITGTRLDISRAFSSLTEALPRKLVKLLHPQDPSKFDYLAPLLTFPEVHIATLNYDLGMEAVGDRRGYAVNTGISAWAGGYEWTWPEDQSIHLLKLHGSLNWSYAQGEFAPPETQLLGASEAPPRSIQSPLRVLQHEKIDEADRGPWAQSRPAMIFGARQKLRADGPFLAMLFEFSRWISNAEHLLVIVGYSFRDEHINVILHEWLATNPEARLSIIDPGFRHERKGSLSDFGKRLMDGVTWYDIGGTRGSSIQPRKHSQIVNLGASEGLKVLADTL